MCNQYQDLYTRLLAANKDVEILTKALESYNPQPPKIDPWGGCACGSSSTCGTTFTTDKSGVTVDNSKDTIDYPPYEGRYTVLVKKETN